MEPKPNVSQELTNEIDRISKNLSNGMRIKHATPPQESETRKNNKRTRVYFQIALEHLASRRDALTADNMRALCIKENPPWTGSDFDKLSLEIAKLRDDYLDTEFKEDERLEITGGESPILLGVLPEDLIPPSIKDEIKSANTRIIDDRLTDISLKHLPDPPENKVYKPDNRVPNALFAVTGLGTTIQNMTNIINRGECDKKFFIKELHKQNELIRRQYLTVSDILEGKT